jgi:hypothetical protein
MKKRKEREREMGEGRSERIVFEMWKMNHGGRRWEELQRL